MKVVAHDNNVNIFIMIWESSAKIKNVKSPQMAADIYGK